MTRLPELEQELVATAARLSRAPRRFERRARTLVPAVALACIVAAALVAVGLFESNDDGVVRSGGSPTATDGGFGPDATLEDMFGIFRQPQTAADDMGFTKDEMDEVPDRQPGEDFTQSRRVEWPGVRIFMWPMRDGACYGVPGGSGCVPLDALRRSGVSVGMGFGRGGRSVYGVVVDGIREVTLTSNGAPELRVPVRENFFYVDLDGSRPDLVRWQYAGREHDSNIVSSFPEDPDPDAGFNVLDGSQSDPVRFTAGGTSYAATGYQATNDTVCILLDETQIDRRPSLGCEGTRGLHRRLDEQPAHLFGGGETATGLVRYAGFAREDVVEVEPVENTGESSVVLSEPWIPAPWEGKPIRFLLVFGPAPSDPAPGDVKWPQLRVRLADGRVLELPV